MGLLRFLNLCQVNLGSFRLNTMNIQSCSESSRTFICDSDGVFTKEGSVLFTAQEFCRVLSSGRTFFSLYPSKFYAVVHAEVFDFYYLAFYSICCHGVDVKLLET